MPINGVRNSMNLNYTFYGKITKNYGWELDFFRKVRCFSDGISFLILKLSVTDTNQIILQGLI